MGQAPEIPDEMLEQVSRRFRCLGEPFRLRVLSRLSIGETSVGALVEALHGCQANVSKHLKLLYDDGIVARRKEGTSVLYSISDRNILKLCDLVCRSVAEKSIRRAAVLGKPKAGRYRLLNEKRRGKHAS